MRHADRFAQALSCFASTAEAPDVVLVRESAAQWLCPGRAWSAAREAMSGMPPCADRTLAFAELMRRLGGTAIASTVPAGCRGAQAERIVLVALAVRAGLIDERTARAMSAAVPL